MESHSKFWIVINSAEDYCAICVACQKEYHAEKYVEYDIFKAFASSNIDITKVFIKREEKGNLLHVMEHGRCPNKYSEQCKEDELLYHPVSYTHLTLPTNREV